MLARVISFYTARSDHVRLSQRHHPVQWQRCKLHSSIKFAKGEQREIGLWVEGEADDVLQRAAYGGGEF